MFGAMHADLLILVTMKKRMILGRLYAICDSTSRKGSTRGDQQLRTSEKSHGLRRRCNTGFLAPVGVDGKTILLGVQLVARRLKSGTALEFSRWSY